ncbi:hypothetical protein KY284_005334 [Solanum tuberosum]|nr:hypothetical protein KY284_005334 [Solanum tuberosum]
MIYQEEKQEKNEVLQLPSTGHFARECTEPKKAAFLNASLSDTYVSNTSLLSESYPMWIVDSASTDYVSQDTQAFVEFYQVSSKSRLIYVENNAKMEVKDCNPSTYDYYVDRCVMTYYSSNTDIDVITGHARLGHIGQDRMNRLTKE